MAFTSRAVAATALALALALPAGAAHARGNDWTTVAKVRHGKLQACKEATTKDGPWKIHLRVDARQATTAVKGSAQVQKQGEAVSRRWRSGSVEPGDVSSSGTLRLPRRSGYQLEAQIEGDGAGTGVVGSAQGIHRC